MKKMVVAEFSGENSQLKYIQKAEEGLWLSKEYASKYPAVFYVCRK